jgi:uncharacterized Zn ribbon protein
MDNMQHMCEECRRRTDLTYIRKADAYLCDECIAAWAAVEVNEESRHERRQLGE